MKMREIPFLAHLRLAVTGKGLLQPKDVSESTGTLLIEHKRLRHTLWMEALRGPNLSAGWARVSLYSRQEFDPKFFAIGHVINANRGDGLVLQIDWLKPAIGVSTNRHFFPAKRLVLRERSDAGYCPGVCMGKNVHRLCSV